MNDYRDIGRIQGERVKVSAAKLRKDTGDRVEGGGRALSGSQGICNYEEKFSGTMQTR